MNERTRETNLRQKLTKIVDLHFELLGLCQHLRASLVWIPQTQHVQITTVFFFASLM